MHVVPLGICTCVGAFGLMVAVQAPACITHHAPWSMCKAIAVQCMCLPMPHAAYLVDVGGGHERFAIVAPLPHARGHARAAEVRRCEASHLVGVYAFCAGLQVTEFLRGELQLCAATKDSSLC